MINHVFISFSAVQKKQFTAALVVCITAMINHVFISFSVVQIYDPSYIGHIYSFALLKIEHNV